MDTTIESDTSHNTNCNSLLRTTYSEDDSDNENNSTNNVDSILGHMELFLKTTEVKTLAQRKNSITLVPFSQRTNSFPLSVPLTTKIRFFSVAIFCFLLLNSLVLCNGLNIFFVQLGVLATVFIALLYIYLFQLYKI